MYAPLLFIHSLLRWALLAAGLNASVRAARGAAKGAAFEKGDRIAGLLFLIFSDLQLLFGLGLYFGVGIYSKTALLDMKHAMKDRVLRFWGVEHLTLMLLAITAVHLGRALSKRAPTDAMKHRRARNYYLAALVLMLAGIPWPGLPYGRSLIPGM